MSEYDAYLAACKTGTYISNKISDLLRSAKDRKTSSAEVNPDVVDEERDDSMELDSEADDPEVVHNEANGLEELDEQANTPDKVDDELDGSKEIDNVVDDDREESVDLVDDSVNRNVDQPASGNESELNSAQTEEHEHFNDSDAHTDEENEENEKHENRKGNGIDVEDLKEEENEEKKGDE